MKEQKAQKSDSKEFSAGVVVYFTKDGVRHYLLLHYPGGHYDFAKGHLEAGESEMQAAIRELEEETGIKEIKIIDGFEHKLEYFFRRKGKTVHKTVTFYLGEVPDNKITISFEHQGFLWLDYDQAIRQITFENARLILKNAEQFLNQSN